MSILVTLQAEEKYELWFLFGLIDHFGLK
jgi:RNase P/RNase MRP subunit p30